MGVRIIYATRGLWLCREVLNAQLMLSNTKSNIIRRSTGLL